MFDIGWSEIGLIAIVAIIVIGPKEMPQVMRQVARVVRAARKTLREFQGQVDDIIRAEEVAEIRKEIESYGIHNIPEQIEQELRNTADLMAQNASQSEPALPETYSDSDPPITPPKP